MSSGSKSKAGIFLLEFTIVLLIFALSSIVSIRLFAKSAEIQATVSDTDQAVVYAQSVAELLKGCVGTDESIRQIVGQSNLMYFNQNQQICDKENAVFVISTDYKSNLLEFGSYVFGTINVSKGDALLYSLPFGGFYPPALEVIP